MAVEVMRRMIAGEDGRNGATEVDDRQEGAPLDFLLTAAALNIPQRLLPVGALRDLAAAVSRHPLHAARQAGGLAATLVRIGAGRADVTPARDDRRFGDPAWSNSWLLRRVLQSYLATGRALDEVISDAGLEAHTEARLRFAGDNLMDALAPTNFLWSNPTAIKATVDEGGSNLLRGIRNLAELLPPPHLPAMVDSSAFTVGQNLAATPGAVVHRTEVFELIQYRPQTEQVRSLPLLVVPPLINKYYILDLAPGRSLIEYCVRQGQQVFAISWRNPHIRHRRWNVDTYAQAIAEALEAVYAITRAGSGHVLALCSGGVVAAGLASHLAELSERPRLAGLTLGVCVLDQGDMGAVTALASARMLKAARAMSARRGYLDGRELAAVFAWLRPNDLIWSYVVNNYLLGRRPPAFDILYWNSDTVRMAAGLHHDFISIGLDNLIATPGGFAMLDTPVDLGAVEVDSYVVAGATDHICPWESCYRTTQLLGGRVRFVLSTSGHIAAMVNPPGNDRASYRVSDGPHPADAEAWRKAAPRQSGSWWEDWNAWLAERSGPTRAAPKTLGNRTHPAAEPAPGTYVLAT
jgi:polyhydroxyalkanoate synthase